MFGTSIPEAIFREKILNARLKLIQKVKIDSLITYILK